MGRHVAAPKLIGRRGITTRVISGVDIALWDIKGKVADRPVYKVLGGFADRVPVYIAGGYYEEGKGLEELAAEMGESVSMGARAIKMKIGGASINEDVERVRVVREAVGPDVKVMVSTPTAPTVTTRPSRSPGRSSSTTSPGSRSLPTRTITRATG